MSVDNLRDKKLRPVLAQVQHEKKVPTNPPKSTLSVFFRRARSYAFPGGAFKASFRFVTAICSALHVSIPRHAGADWLEGQGE